MSSPENSAATNRRRFPLPLRIGLAAATLVAAGCAIPHHSTGQTDPTAGLPRATVAGTLTPAQFADATAKAKVVMRAVLANYGKEKADPLCDGEVHTAHGENSLTGGSDVKTLTCQASATATELAFTSTSASTEDEPDGPNVNMSATHGMTLAVSHPDHNNSEATRLTFTYNALDGQTPTSTTYVLQNERWGALAATPDAMSGFIGARGTVVRGLGFTATGYQGGHYESMDMTIAPQGPNHKATVVYVGLGADSQPTTPNLTEPLTTLLLDGGGAPDSADDLRRTALL